MELNLTIADESDEKGYIITANILYHFGGSEKTIPFILGGIGYGNALNIFSL